MDMHGPGFNTNAQNEAKVPTRKGNILSNVFDSHFLNEHAPVMNYSKKISNRQPSFPNCRT